MNVLGTLVVSVAFLLPPVAIEPAAGRERIVTREEVARATQPGWIAPLSVISWPHRKITRGMEKGLISFERHRIRERTRLWMEDLRSRGIEPRFGGSGEGTGFGGGGTYRILPGDRHMVEFLGLATFKGYREFGMTWRMLLPASRLIAETSYQWRPQENFYGLGQNSSKEKHSQFALRQSWGGVRWEVNPANRLTIGVLHRVAWLKATEGRNEVYSPPEVFFEDVPWYRRETSLHSTGLYFDLDGIREEYELGGAAHWGSSYQRGRGGSKGLRYFTHELQLEGRLPVVPGNSALVGQANFEINRPRGGSEPIPFYLQPRVGGSSTLRGFELDRFYGMNLILLSVEYRFKVHPNIQAFPFFDEGQVYNNRDELHWFDWHRNYGFGLRFRSANGTFMRIEFGVSSEGSQFHITFGDRERPPLRGPIRYGAYKR